ncbi:hypothetical protein K2X30_02080 [bacterium]|nr:hypothetical protein [bacterium]
MKNSIFSGGSVATRFRLAVFLVAFASLSFSGCVRERPFLYPAPPDPHAVEVVKNINELISARPRPVDVLWVIDNSASMGPYQKNIQDNLERFMAAFIKKNADVSWRMGLLSTDTREEPYIGFGLKPLDSHSRNPTLDFAEAVFRLGEGGDDNEKMFEPVQNVMKYHPEFFRPDAMLVLVVVTDVDDSFESSNEFGRVSPLVFAKDLLKLKKFADRISLYGIFAAPDVENYGCKPEVKSNFTFEKSRYGLLFSKFQHQVFAACSPFFGDSLAAMGQNIIDRAYTFVPRIELEQFPVEGSVHVFYNGQELPGGTTKDAGFWTYDSDENSVLLNDKGFILPNVDSVVVRYLAN